MFFKNIVKDADYKVLLEKYDIDYLDSINTELFLSNYKYLVSKKIYFVNDLILRDLDIFLLDREVLEEVLEIAYQKYGKEYIYVLGDNLNIFDDILMSILER